MKKYIKSAEEKQTVRDVYEEKIDNIEDDISYLLAGIDKMARDGGESLERAIAVASEFYDTIQTYIDRVAGEVTE